MYEIKEDKDDYLYYLLKTKSLTHLENLLWKQLQIGQFTSTAFKVTKKLKQFEYKMPKR